MPRRDATALLARRLKAARLALGITQTELGIRMGLDDGVASTRINRYEQAVHPPSLDVAKAMAEELGVPLAYLVAENDRLAQAILGFARLTMGDQEKILAEIARLGRFEERAEAKADRTKLEQATAQVSKKPSRRMAR